MDDSADANALHSDVSAAGSPLTTTHECKDSSSPQDQAHITASPALVTKLSLLDKLLTPLILLCMIVGVIIGEFVPSVQSAFDTVRFKSVSVRTSTVTH